MQTESVESEISNELTMGSEKEQHEEVESIASQKEIVSASSIEVSSLGSEKEELMEKSYGSGKEYPKASSREHDNSSGKSRYIEYDLGPSDIDIEESQSIEVSFRDIDASSSNKEVLPEPESKDSRKEIKITSDESSAKELIQEKVSEGSSKELIAEVDTIQDESEEISQGSDKEIRASSEISNIRIRIDPNHPGRGYIDKRSFHSASAKYVEITSSDESEMNTNDNKRYAQDDVIIDFYEMPESSNGSSKELEIEYSTGSSKEEYAAEEYIAEEPVPKSEHSSKEFITKKDSELPDGEIESKESSKQLFASIDMFKESIGTPILEESEEEERASSIKIESLSSHCEQISESEREPTPTNQEPYLDPKIRNSVLKINTILKKTPTSLALIARNYINASKPPVVSHSQPNPIPQPARERQQLHDYGESSNSQFYPKPNNRYQKPTGNSERQVNKSLENLPARNNEYNDYAYPEDKKYQQPHSDPNRGMLLSDLPFNKPNKARTSISDESKGTFGPDQTALSRFRVDWATTPIYTEYLEDGVTKYNQNRHQAFYDEEEAPAIFKLIKTRYASTNNSRAVEPFFHKAMDTLGEIMGSFSMTHLYRAIQKIYTKADIQNTLKLVLRVQSMFKARYLIFQIFHDIHEFKVSK